MYDLHIMFFFNYVKSYALFQVEKKDYKFIS
jgi:hypothetical protein